MQEEMDEETKADFNEFRRQRKNAYIYSQIRKLEATLLRKNASLMEIKQMCDAAKRYHCICVCVQPIYVKCCKARLNESGVRVCALVGGTGESTLKVKLFELKNAIKDGADEIEFVPCTSAVVNGNWGYVRREIKKVHRITKKGVLKIRLDEKSLSEENFLALAKVSSDIGVPYLSLEGDTKLVEKVRQIVRFTCACKGRSAQTAQQLELLLGAGCERVASELPNEIAEELLQESDER